MSDIKKAFRSRWMSGVILELDFSQLEIYVLAYLSGDEQLKRDLLSGNDLHNISATLLFGNAFTDAQRKIAKQLSFQLQYGAGAASMADSNGIPVDDAKRFIENYYKRYQGVAEYHKDLIEQLVELREPGAGLRTPKGIPAGVAKVPSLTGRFYTHVEGDAPDFMANPKFKRSKPILTSFSPTKAKNYPVQGFATADIVPMVVGKLYRELVNSHLNFLVLAVNTIHDSVIYDCYTEDYAILWAKLAKEIMEDAPNELKRVFGIDFDLPLRAGVTMGTNWHDMKKLDFK